MDTKNEIRVNHLPSLTWNRLGVNHSSVEVKTELRGVATTVTYGFAQEGVTEKVIGTEEAEAFVGAHAHGVRREKYIAGKTSIYMTQPFQTALGGEFTEYVREMAGDAEIIRIAKDTSPEKPLIINYDFGEGADDCTSQIFCAEENSEATVIINYRSAREAAGFSAVLSRIILGKGAKLHLIKVGLLGQGFVQLDDTGAVLEEGAVLDFRQMELGGAKTYTGCYADQSGDKSAFYINSGYMVQDKHHLDVNYVTAQRGKKTVSNFQIKGVLTDEATKTLRDTIDFRNGSSGSVGDEQEDVLLLDPKVENKSVPVILCEEEDVDGRHGASIGRLSDDVLYYLESRGIGQKAAEVMMIRGRLHSISREIPDQETRDAIDEFIGEAFGSDE